MRDGFVGRECMHIELTHIVGEIQLLQYPAKNRMSNRFWIIDNKANGHRLAPYSLLALSNRHAAISVSMAESSPGRGLFRRLTRRAAILNKMAAS